MSAPPAEIAQAFASFPVEHQGGLRGLRDLILEVAGDVGAAPVSEVLRWGQPSYQATDPRKSTTVRLASTGDGEHFGLFFHCQSKVIPEFRAQFPRDFTYDGNRGILFRPGDDLQVEKLALCINHALTYRS